MVDLCNNVFEKATEIYGWTDPKGLIILMIEIGKNEGHVKGLSYNINDTKKFIDQADMIIRQARDNKREQITRGELDFMQLEEKMEQKGLVGNKFVDFIDRFYAVVTTGIPYVGGVWHALQNSTKIAIIRCISKHILLDAVLEKQTLTGIIAKIVASPVLVSYGIAAIPIVWEIVRSLWLWKNGEISSERAKNNITKTFLVSLGSFLGTCCGVLVCPVAPFFGGAIGGIAGSYYANSKFTQLFGDIYAPTQALDDAYKYLGLFPCSSNNEVISVYERRFFIDHPENGGSSEAFCKLTVYASIIYKSRGLNFRRDGYFDTSKKTPEISFP